MELRISLSGERPDELALRQFVAVGLLRGEFLFRDREVYLTNDDALTDLASYVAWVCDAFAGKPVWYRLADFWSDEANVLAGNHHILEESNPLVGIRGIRRILAYPEDSALEINAVARVAENRENLHLLMPFVQDGDEMAEAVSLCRRVGWRNRIGSMLEIPSSVFRVADIVRAGATNLLIGLNDLTSLLLGRERGPHEMKLNAAVWQAVTIIRDTVNDTEWGIAGSMNCEVLLRAELAGLPYASVHYSELPVVLGSSFSDLADLDFVRRVKEKTKAAQQTRLRHRASRTAP